jgi:hypothetical protein
MSADVRLDCSKMSSLTKRLLGSSVFADLVEHFNDPENQRRFEVWKKEQAEKEQAALKLLDV